MLCRVSSFQKIRDRTQPPPKSLLAYIQSLCGGRDFTFHGNRNVVRENERLELWRGEPKVFSHSGKTCTPFFVSWTGDRVPIHRRKPRKLRMTPGNLKKSWNSILEPILERGFFSQNCFGGTKISRSSSFWPSRSLICEANNPLSARGSLPVSFLTLYGSSEKDQRSKGNSSRLTNQGAIHVCFLFLWRTSHPPRPALNSDEC